MALPHDELSVLAFWKDKQIFQKTIEQSQDWPYFSFYDGPPFATGLPHYGHILASTIKDAVVRYWYMHGFRVDRRVGWDCHGLPIENLIEKEIGIKGGKKEIIEKYGIEQFNLACKAAVFRTVKDFEEILQRVGRWADYPNAYATMDSTYTESIWWVFKQLYDQGFIYEDYRVTPYCPRCGTPLSNFEVNQGYKDSHDLSVIVELKITHPDKIISDKKEVFLLAWTTTPWTLPGNMLLAVDPAMEYVVFSASEADKLYIVAKSRLQDVIGDSAHTVIKTLRGNELVGLVYQPLFPYFANSQNAFRVVAADFVNAEEGTGIVHIAPGFGEDDYKLGKQEGLKPIVHVLPDGTFTPEVSDFAGLPVKPKEDQNSTDKKIVAYLDGKNRLWNQEQITHTYPFCWRCDTPLLYYPINSWYVAVTQFKDQLVANNQKINWMPKHIKDGRFGKWLEGARDWSISRNRFWGAALPLWRCQDCQKITAIGSLPELKKHVVPSNNTYLIMRHGEAEHNVKHLVDGDINNDTHLTQAGREQIKQAAVALKDKKIDLIIASDFIRTKETVALIAQAIGIKEVNIIFDERLREVNGGELNGQAATEYQAFLGDSKDKLAKIPTGGESLVKVKQRILAALYDCEQKYAGKTILIVSHDYPLWMLWAGAQGLDNAAALSLLNNQVFVANATVKALEFMPLPHDNKYVLDLHRPYIDSLKLNCPDCGKQMTRVEEVFDCWFESGSMPYAQWHYPFENKAKVEKTFPADFIAEGMDQTRGWFYTLHVLAGALTHAKSDLGHNQPAFKNVISHGLILGEDGKKLSKRLKNYAPLDVVLEKYGADALRYFLLASTQVGEDYVISQKGIAGALQRVVATLRNCLAFYSMYCQADFMPNQQISNNILDKWIISLLNSLIKNVDKEMQAYELTRASRLLSDFIDDLSNWYIRRCRSRFQKPVSDEDLVAAKTTLQTVLKTFSIVIAPFMPFMAEIIYQHLKTPNSPESVHLAKFPQYQADKIDRQLEEAMAQTRALAAQALALRAEIGIKVRQPLASFTIDKTIDPALETLLAQEINVKQIIAGKELKLDTTLTEELIREGDLREIERAHATLRKELGLAPSDIVAEVAIGDEPLIAQQKPVDWKAQAITIFDAATSYDKTIQVDLTDKMISLGIKK